MNGIDEMNALVAEQEHTLRAVRALVATFPHECWWESGALGSYAGTQHCTRCRLEVALGGVDANGHRDE